MVGRYRCSYCRYASRSPVRCDAAFVPQIAVFETFVSYLARIRIAYCLCSCFCYLTATQIALVGVSLTIQSIL